VLKSAAVRVALVHVHVVHPHADRVGRAEDVESFHADQEGVELADEVVAILCGFLTARILETKLAVLLEAVHLEVLRYVVARYPRSRVGFAVAIMLVLALALLAAPLAASAEQVFRIGILGNVPLTDPEGSRNWGAFIQGLRDLGYVEGRNITIEHRSSEGHYERLPELAAELARLKVDVIVVPASQNAFAAKQATRTIPIVMTGDPDPVGAGLVVSLARPGGNVTGLSMLSPEMVGKELELLKEIVPRVSRVAILVNPTNPTQTLWLGHAKVAARTLGVELQALEARGPDNFERAFAAMTRERAGALFVVADGMFLLHRTRIVGLAAKHRLPAMYALRGFVDAGGLVVYGASLSDNSRRAATYVDKILKGANPADLPIEQPTKLELVINLKTAKALGLTIPPSVLLRADEVIQ
jgi:putative ABC transport system substrate-binding protein